MKSLWTESMIREEMAKLDNKTGLRGAELPITFNNAKCTLGLYCSNNGGSFKFSNYYFQDPEWPIESALDVIRHEYAHHMDHVLYGHSGHGSTWKICCRIVGATPIRCYNESRAEYYRQKHIKEDKLSERYDQYKIGDYIEHPKHGIGRIEDIFGEGVHRCVSIRFKNNDCKRFGLAWIDNNCQKSDWLSK
ncbi:MAG: hypothetical protein IKK09_03435 [Clostridia bacterium]|nr:hypothetical protein [Clostridia bacterium]